MIIRDLVMLGALVGFGYSQLQGADIDVNALLNNKQEVVQEAGDVEEYTDENDDVDVDTKEDIDVPADDSKDTDTTNDDTYKEDSEDDIQDNDVSDKSEQSDTVKDTEDNDIDDDDIEDTDEELQYSEMDVIDPLNIINVQRKGKNLTITMDDGNVIKINMKKNAKNDLQPTDKSIEDTLIHPDTVVDFEEIDDNYNFYLTDGSVISMTTPYSEESADYDLLNDDTLEDETEENK